MWNLFFFCSTGKLYSSDSVEIMTCDTNDDVSKEETPCYHEGPSLKRCQEAANKMMSLLNRKQAQLINSTSTSKSKSKWAWGYDSLKEKNPVDLESESD